MAGRGKGRQLRVDARRNHELIMNTAQELLPRHGLDLSMEQIARACGVGVGTLYRRFGSREALLAAVAEGAFQRVMSRARTALDPDLDPWQALTGFLTGSVDELRTVAVLSAWYPHEWEQVRVGTAERERRATLMDCLTKLMARARSSGAIRPDVSNGDVTLLLTLILRPVSGVPSDTDTARRHLTIMLDGLRPAPLTPLPGQPATLGE